MTQNLRQNLIDSTKSCTEKRSYHGKNGVSLKDGEWQLSAKLARVLGVVPGTAEYAQVACRQAEKELYGLRQATMTPSLSRSPSPRLVHKDDQEQVEAIPHAEDAEDDLGRHTSASTRNVLIRGLSEAMAHWKEEGGKVDSEPKEDC
ncbi:hypothetical protein QFC20_004155 [Naganishia adeliensis]|uniref:Uncharacterized protein n=1 Tax=Naganishia adeliensis TaxID=92952 RepID=A0ACC2W5Q0_9TREE|nr:hypothetical protein QFC20_004155 [Naganishia adeliensis]